MRPFAELSAAVPAVPVSSSRQYRYGPRLLTSVGYTQFGTVHLLPVSLVVAAKAANELGTASSSVQPRHEDGAQQPGRPAPSLRAHQPQPGAAQAAQAGACEHRAGRGGRPLGSLRARPVERLAPGAVGVPRRSPSVGSRVARFLVLLVVDERRDGKHQARQEEEQPQPLPGLHPDQRQTHPAHEQPARARGPPTW